MEFEHLHMFVLSEQGAIDKEMVAVFLLQK